MCLGVPGKIVEIYEKEGLRMGKVDFAGVTRESCLTYVPDAAEGDYVVVHVGFAISKISEEDAHETLQLLHEINSFAQAEEEARSDEALK